MGINQLIPSLAPFGGAAEKERRRVIREVVLAENYFNPENSYWKKFFIRPKRERALIKGGEILHKGKRLPAEAQTIIPLILGGVKIKGLRKLQREHETKEAVFYTRQSGLLSPDQIGFVKSWLAHPRLICGHEMGKGKTASAIIALAEACRGVENIRKAVICTTKSTIPNWISEIEKFGLPFEAVENTLELAQLRKRVKSIKQGKAGAVKSLKSGGGLFGGKFEEAQSGLGQAQIILCTHAAMEEGGKLLRLIGGADTLILDEAHLCANTATLRGRGLCKWAKQTKNILMLTGTPLNKISMQELEFYLEILYPNMLPANFLQEAFMGKKDGKKAFVNAEKLTKLIGAIMPGRLVWDDESRRLYLDANLRVSIEEIQPTAELLDAVKIINKKEAHPFAKKAQINRLLEPAKLAKAEELIAAQLEAGKKAVVFSAINSYLEELKLRYGAEAVMLTGKTQNRKEAIAKFINDKSVKVFLGNIIAAGTGINLQNTDKVIIIEGGYRRQDIQQAIARVFRRGNTHKEIMCQYIMVNGIELDRRKLEIVDRKTSAVSLLIDGTTESITGKVDLSSIRTQAEEEGMKAAAEAKLQRRTAHNGLKDRQMSLRSRMDSRERFALDSKNIFDAFLAQ